MNTCICSPRRSDFQVKICTCPHVDLRTNHKTSLLLPTAFLSFPVPISMYLTFLHSLSLALGVVTLFCAVRHNTNRDSLARHPLRKAVSWLLCSLLSPLSDVWTNFLAWFQSRTFPALLPVVKMVGSDWHDLLLSSCICLQLAEGRPRAGRVTRISRLEGWLFSSVFNSINPLREIRLPLPRSAGQSQEQRCRVGARDWCKSEFLNR